VSGADRRVDAAAFVTATSESFAVRALDVLNSFPSSLPSWALIGGVSVAVNLAGFHRPTGDVDTVSIDGESAIAVLVGQGAVASRNGVTMTVGATAVDVDVIDVSAGDAGTGAFLAHRFALESAVLRTLQVVTTTGQLLVETRIRVATPEAIVAMKVHSVEGRRESRPEKRSGDIYDVVRLVAAFGSTGIARGLRDHASTDLVLSTSRMCRKYFIDEVDRSFRWLRMDSREVISSLDRADLASVGELPDLLGA
jgi:hypothetical protein